MAREWQKDLKNLDGNFTSAIDANSQGLVTVSQTTHEINVGDHYFITNYSTLGSGGKKVFVLKTPALSTARVHLEQFSVVGSDDTTIELVEDATGVTGATTATVYNSHRNSPNMTAMTVLTDPTTITTGTVIYAKRLGSNKETAQAREGSDLILDENTTYLFRFTSNAASNNVNWDFHWYED